MGKSLRKTDTEITIAPSPTRGNPRVIFDAIKEVSVDGVADFAKINARSQIAFGANRAKQFSAALDYLVDEGYIIERKGAGLRTFEIASLPYYQRAQLEKLGTPPFIAELSKTSEPATTELSTNENFMLVMGFLLGFLSCGISAVTFLSLS